MAEKPCLYCEVLPAFPTLKVNVVFLVDIDFLLQKLSSLLRENSINHTLSANQIIVPEVDFEGLLLILQDNNLSEYEQEKIKVGYYTPGDAENFLSILLRFKPLKTYLALICYYDYIDILKNDRLIVHYHPIVDISQKKIIGFECLIRGVKSDGNIVSPAYLFEAAKATDTLFYLDRSCRETAIKTSAAKRLIDKKVFINFLPTVIFDPKFCLQSTINWVYELKLDPKNLVFEVVETEKVKDLKHLRRILDCYRENGFQVALDDVGTGYSSLDVLIELQPNFIKISRELVKDVDNLPIKRDLLKAVVDAMHKNNIEVIAEGIERPEEAKILHSFGVRFMQGFLFAKPNPETIYEVNLHWLT